MDNRKKLFAGDTTITVERILNRNLQKKVTVMKRNQAIRETRFERFSLALPELCVAHRSQEHTILKLDVHWCSGKNQTFNPPSGSGHRGPNKLLDTLCQVRLLANIPSKRGVGYAFTVEAAEWERQAAFGS